MPPLVPVLGFVLVVVPVCVIRLVLAPLRPIWAIAQRYTDAYLGAFSGKARRAP